MSVYMLVESKVRDLEKYRQYIAQVTKVVTQHEGRFLVRGGAITPLGAWKPERIVIIEFPSEAHIRAWLSSPEYQTIAPLRESGAETHAVILEGYAQGREH
jgi:uncharacterized protein (DUF1330 family)